MNKLNLDKVEKASSEIQERLLLGHEEEVIINIPIKIIVGSDGKIVREEFVSFMDAYNKLVTEEQIQEAMKKFGFK